MNKIVTLTNIVANFMKTKRDGGTYSCTVVQYTDQSGQPGEASVNTNFLQKWGQKFQAELDACRPGQLVELFYQKKGQWTNFVSIKPSNGTLTPSAEPAFAASSTSSSSKGGKFDSAGAQVGNALTNAASLMAAGKYGEMTLEQAAAEVLKTGELLKARLIAGEFKAVPIMPVAAPAPVAVAAPVAQPVAGVVESAPAAGPAQYDEEIPF